MNFKPLFILLFFILIIVQSVNAVVISIKTLPEKPTTGNFVIHIDVSSQNSIQNANLFLSGLISESLSLGDFTGKTSVEFEAHVDKPGIYELEVRLSYIELVNGTPESGYLRCNREIVVIEKPQFEILGAEGSVRPGENGKVVVKVVNKGGDAKDVKLSFDGMIAKDVDRFFDVWKSEEVKRLEFIVFAEDDAEIGEHEVKLGLECRDFLGNTYSLELPFSVSVVGSPKLIISDFSAPKIHSDSNFTLKLGIENVGEEKAKDVRIKLKLPKGFSGESSAYLGEIGRDETKTAEFELKVAKNVSGSCIIPVVISCENWKWSDNLTIYVFPLEPIHIDIAGVYTIPKRLEKGKPFTLNLAIENSGKEVAKGVKIELKLPKDFEGRNTYFVGTLESGDSATSTFELKAGKAGRYEISAIITYLDPTLQRHTTTQNFTIYVFPSQNYAPIALAVIVALAIGLALKMRRRP